jgi:penicillin-binding protein 1A
MRPTLMRLVTGYAEFVNGGKKISASLVDRIQDRNGKTIWRHDERKCEGCNDTNWHAQEEPLLADTREQIIDSRTAYQIVSMLQGVVQRGTAAYSVGAQIPKPLAGKTGTSSDAKDTWFIGFFARSGRRRLCRLRQSAHPGPHEQGATVAAPIFRDFHEGGAEGRAAHAVPYRARHRGSGDRLEERQSGSRGTPGAIMEAFKAGTAPGEANAPSPEGAPNAAPPPPGRASARRRRLRGEGTGGLYYSYLCRSPMHPPCVPKSSRAADDIQQAIALLRRHL